MTPDPDHYLTHPMDNQEAIHLREIARLRDALEQCRDALRPLQDDYKDAKGDFILCAVTCAYAAAVDALEPNVRNQPRDE